MTYHDPCQACCTGIVNNRQASCMLPDGTLSHDRAARIMRGADPEQWHSSATISYIYPLPRYTYVVTYIYILPSNRAYGYSTVQVCGMTYVTRMSLIVAASTATERSSYEMERGRARGAGGPWGMGRGRTGGGRQVGGRGTSGRPQASATGRLRPASGR